MLSEKRGDLLRNRFQHLLEGHRGIVFKVANAYSRHAEDRRDLAQEICAQLWKATQHGMGCGRSRPGCTALNVAISFVRGDSRRTSVALDEIEGEPGHDGEAERENLDGVRALYRFIGRLDPLNRALLLLYLDEKSQREIAEILGIGCCGYPSR
ncbi:MAG: sigma-70 family RNA polymerase sigma factor [Dokdonella sp.]